MQKQDALISRLLPQPFSLLSGRVDYLRSDRNRGQDGWVWKVGNKLATGKFYQLQKCPDAAEDRAPTSQSRPPPATRLP